MENEHIKLSFKNLDMKSVIKYLVNTSNELSLFNPALTDGELFECYNSIASTYKKRHGGLEYLEDEVQINMEYFFSLETDVPKPVQLIIRAELQRALPAVEQLKEQELSIVIQIPTNTPEALTVEVPVVGEPTPEVEEVASTEAHKESIETNEVPPSFFHPVEVLDDILSNTRKKNFKNIEHFLPVTTRLVGIAQEDKRDIEEVLFTVVDILLSRSNYQQDILISDIVDFIYDKNNEAMYKLDDYLNIRTLALYSGQMKVANFLKGTTILRNHLTNMLVALHNPLESNPLSQQSQWLLAYADYIETGMLLVEGEEK